MTFGTTLSSTVKQLSDPSLSVQNVARIGTQFVAVGTAVKNMKIAV